MPRKIISEFLIASRESDGGATQFTLFDDESLKVSRKYPCPFPVWIEIHNDRLCTILRPDPNESYVEYSLITGEKILEYSLVNGNAKGSTHFCRSGKDIYVAYYASGHVMKIGNEPIQQQGYTGPNTLRQDGAHAHQCLFSPDKRFVLVNDLGLDTIFVYDREMNEYGRFDSPPGHGPRHSIFSHDGKYLYCLGEMGSAVSVYCWNNGMIKHINTVDILPHNYSGINDAASIIITSDGKKMYVSNRGANTICQLNVNGASLDVVSQTDCGGDHPRAISLIADDRYLVAANTFSHNFVLFRVDSKGELTPIKSVDLKSPLSIAEL